MVITNIRFAFIEVETLADPLAAVAAPVIPYAFLLNQAGYERALDDAINLRGSRHTPWDDDYGKLFWYYYLERKREFSVTFKEAWRGLIPLWEPADGVVTAPWLNDATIGIRPLFYPWGVAAIIEVHARGRWTLDKAVALGLKVRTTGKYDWTSEGKTTPLSMNGLMSAVLGEARRRAYGPAAAAGQGAEMFSVVSVLDAEKADADVPVADQSTLHRALDAVVSWSPVWKKTQLEPLAARAIQIKQSLAAPGHVLYGGSRGRAVWFPAGFPSSSRTLQGSLDCYHQNLTASTLQTESLCALARSAAARLAAGQPIGTQSLTYKACAQLAAGILGRLHGGNPGTYRSRSVQRQINERYLPDVNALRQSFKLSPLAA